MLIFRNIGECISLTGAAQKDGRRVRDEDLSIQSKQAILVGSDGRIAWMGEDSKLPSKFAGQSSTEINLDGKAVLPAFTECHTHTVFAGQRAHEFELRQQGVSYQEISKQGGGILSTVKATREASLEELTEIAKKREAMFISQGVSTLEIKSGYALDFEGERKMLRAAHSLTNCRIVTSYLGAHALPTEAKGNQKAYLKKLIDEDLPQIKKEGLAQRCDIFIEKGFFSLEEGKNYLKKAKALGFELCIHADQLSRTQATALAVELGAQSADHAIELSNDDIQSLANSETVAVLLPAADFYMKCAYPKARELIDAGACVALATDFNPGTCPTQDLAFVGMLARMEMKMSLPEVISAYTYGAAKALGLEKDLGSLEVGKFCDFAVLDEDWTNLFYKIGHMPVKATYKEGRLL